MRDGMAAGLFRQTDADAAADAIFSAMIRFFHPHFLRASAGNLPSAGEARHVLDLMIAGLRTEAPFTADG